LQVYINKPQIKSCVELPPFFCEYIFVSFGLGPQYYFFWFFFLQFNTKTN